MITPGLYNLAGKILNDEGVDIGQDTIEAKLPAGNATLDLEFDPIKFIMLGKISQLHLTDLALSMNGKEVERNSEAWSPSQLNPHNFPFNHKSCRSIKQEYIKKQESKPSEF